MSSLGQSLHEHDVLLAFAVALAITAAVFWGRRVRRRWWLTWGAGLGACLALAVALRTPTATISEFRASANEDERASGPGLEVGRVTDSPDLDSVEAIRRLIASGSKPTLLELYSDYGFS
jgi:hypothetical protein